MTSPEFVTDRLLVSAIFNPNPHGRSVSVRAEDPRNSLEKVKYVMKHEMKLTVWIGIFATAALGKHTRICTQSLVVA